MTCIRDQAVLANLRSYWYTEEMPIIYCKECCYRAWRKFDRRGLVYCDSSEDYMSFMEEHPPRESGEFLARAHHDVNTLLRIANRSQTTITNFLALADAAELLLDTDTVFVNETEREQLDSMTVLLKQVLRLRDDSVAPRTRPLPSWNATGDVIQTFHVHSATTVPDDVCRFPRTNIRPYPEHGREPTASDNGWTVNVTEDQWREMDAAGCFETI